MNKKLKFRIIYGYHPNEYIQIDESDLERAKYAWATKSIFVSQLRNISGGEIKRIEEDYRYYTGWTDEYYPKNLDDNYQLKKDVPIKELQDRMCKADIRVRYILSNNRKDLLKDIESVDRFLLLEEQKQLK